MEEREEQQEQKPEERGEDTVVLSRKDYENLLSELAVIKSSLESRRVEEAPKVEEPVEEIDEDDVFSSMKTPKEFYQYIQKTIGQPLLEAITVMSVKSELKEVMSKHPDFEEYSEETKKIAMANPSMSLEDAFLLAKTRKGGVSKAGEQIKPKEQPKPPISEKSGITRSTAQTTGKMTVRQAALEAMKELNLKEGD